MADLILQAAIKEIETAFGSFASGGGGRDYSLALSGQTLNEVVKSAMIANATNGVYVSGSPSKPLFALSCWCEVSACVVGGVDLCGPPLFGSTTQLSSAQYSENIWCTNEVLVPSQAITNNDIITALLALSQLSTVSDLYGLDSSVGDDVLLEYIKLRSVFVTENNTDVLANWYGEGGGSSEVQGRPLSFTDRIKVCDSGWKEGQGPACCTWTVPAGATRAKFQVWGAGQGTNGGGCCCGGNPFGETGAYAELTIDVTAGESYTACAGCSCYQRVCCCSNSTPAEGCGSGVTGTGICCLFASGARCYNSNCDDLNFLRCQSGFAGSACYRFQNPYCTSSGPCWCSYSEYCFDNSCATCGVVPVYPGCCNSCICSCGRTDRNSTGGQNNTIKSMHGGGCLGTDNYGYHTRPPVIDSDTGGIYTGGCWCSSFTSNSCPSRCFYNWNDHPGHGGPYGHVMGGCNNAAGTPGRSGLVQISWT